MSKQAESFKEFFESYYIKASDKPFDGAVEIKDEDYKEIKHLFSNKGDAQTVTDILVNQIKLHPGHAKEAAKIILADDAAVLYLMDRDIDDNGVTLEELVQTGNIYTPFEKREINRETIRALYFYEPATKPSMGKGEILLSAFLKNGGKSAHGDITIDGKLYDVKGENARLGGQRGFSGPAPGSISWFNSLKKFRSDLSGLTKGNDIPPAGSNGYNITKNKIPFQFSAVVSLINSGKITPEQGNEIIESGFLAVYTSLDKGKLKSVEQFINDAVSTNQDGVDWTAVKSAWDVFLNRFPIELLNYYLEIENMADTGLVCCNNKGNVVFLTYNDPDMREKVNITYPAFSAASGSQGAVVGVTVKKVRGQKF